VIGAKGAGRGGGGTLQRAKEAGPEPHTQEVLQVGEAGCILFSKCQVTHHATGWMCFFLMWFLRTLCCLHTLWKQFSAALGHSAAGRASAVHAP
jgi:hypothetical protein